MFSSQIEVFEDTKIAVRWGSVMEDMVAADCSKVEHCVVPHILSEKIMTECRVYSYECPCMIGVTIGLPA